MTGEFYSQWRKVFHWHSRHLNSPIDGWSLFAHDWSFPVAVTSSIPLPRTMNSLLPIRTLSHVSTRWFELFTFSPRTRIALWLTRRRTFEYVLTTRPLTRTSHSFRCSLLNFATSDSSLQKRRHHAQRDSGK
jgi:hypothetical protein